MMMAAKGTFCFTPASVRCVLGNSEASNCRDKLVRRGVVGHTCTRSVLTGGVGSWSVYRRSADYVDKIIKGASPAALPIQLPTKFELVINLKAAKEIGVEIPAHVLAQAAELIE